MIYEWNDWKIECRNTACRYSEVLLNDVELIHMCAKDYQLSDESNQDDRTTATHLNIIIHFLLSKGFIVSFLETIRYCTDGWSNQYHCASSIYILSYIASELLLLFTEYLLHLYMEIVLLVIWMIETNVCIR